MFPFNILCFVFLSTPCNNRWTTIQSEVIITMKLQSNFVNDDPVIEQPRMRSVNSKDARVT